MLNLELDKQQTSHSAQEIEKELQRLLEVVQTALPLLNSEELEQRIQQMRSVEKWLELNLTMLRSSLSLMENQLTNSKVPVQAPD